MFLVKIASPRKGKHLMPGERRDLNPQPTEPQSVALPIALLPPYGGAISVDTAPTLLHRFCFSLPIWQLVGRGGVEPPFSDFQSGTPTVYVTCPYISILTP